MGGEDIMRARYSCQFQHGGEGGMGARNVPLYQRQRSEAGNIGKLWLASWTFDLLILRQAGVRADFLSLANLLLGSGFWFGGLFCVLRLPCPMCIQQRRFIWTMGVASNENKRLARYGGRVDSFLLGMGVCLASLFNTFTGGHLNIASWLDILHMRWELRLATGGSVAFWSCSFSCSFYLSWCWKWVFQHCTTQIIMA
ncbi:hypothetical protein V8F20_011882 [Naviculisporaceae sp. PSN 640]